MELEKNNTKRECREFVLPNKEQNAEANIKTKIAQ